MTSLRHTIPVEHPELLNLIEKTMADELSQEELNKAYDGLCKDYEKVPSFTSTCMVDMTFDMTFDMTI